MAPLRLAALLEGDPTRAEDAVCDAFARVYARVRRGGVDDVAPYLRQAIVNAVRGGWRRREVERRHSPALFAAVAVVEFESAVVERDEVWRALAALTPGQRRVVVLRYYEDLPEAEVATKLASYNLLSIAVCDDEQCLLGAVTVDDVLDRLLPSDWRHTSSQGAPT